MDASEIIPAQTVVAECHCAGCGKTVGIKLSKTGFPYYYCKHTTEAGWCAHHERWSKAEGHALRRAFEAEGGPINVTRPIERGATVQQPPQPGPEPAGQPKRDRGSGDIFRDYA